MPVYSAAVSELDRTNRQAPREFADTAQTSNNKLAAEYLKSRPYPASMPASPGDEETLAEIEALTSEPEVLTSNFVDNGSNKVDVTLTFC